MVSLALSLASALSAHADPALPEPLDPAAFAAAVLQQHPGPRAAEAATAVARARREAADTLPETRISLELAPAMLLEDPPAYELGLEQMLPAWGSRPARRAVADAQIRASEADLEQVRAALAAAAVVALTDRWLAERRLEAMTTQRAWMASELEAARGRLGAGRGGSADLFMLEAEIASMDAEIAMEEAARESAGARMRALLGAPAEAALPALSLPLPAPLPPPAEAATSRAARARAEAATAEIDAMKAMNRPMLGLMAGHGTMMMDGVPMAFVGAELVLPWGGAARLDEASAMAAMAEAEAAWMSDEAAAMVAEAEAGARAARRRLEILESALLPAAERRLEAERAMLAAGMGGLDLALDAARALTAARQSAAEARAELWRMSAERAAALGQTFPLEVQP